MHRNLSASMSREVEAPTVTEYTLSKEEFGAFQCGCAAVGPPSCFSIKPFKAMLQLCDSHDIKEKIILYFDAASHTHAHDHERA